MTGTTRVTTNGTTKFEGAACSALANGAHVEVEGARLADGSIAAAKVKFDDD
jgi:hypothetical protein